MTGKIIKVVRNNGTWVGDKLVYEKDVTEIKMASLNKIRERWSYRFFRDMFQAGATLKVAKVVWESMDKNYKWGGQAIADRAYESMMVAWKETRST